MFSVLKKIKISHHQQDGTTDRADPKVSFPHQDLRPADFPREKKAEAEQSWEGGARESHLPLFQSLDPRGVEWQHPSSPLALSGRTPGTSLSHMIWLLTILTRNLSLTGGWGVEARNELSEGAQTFLRAPSPFPERFCAHNPSRISGAQPRWGTCSTSVEEHKRGSAHLCLFIPEGATVSCLVQPIFPYRSTNVFCLG